MIHEMLGCDWGRALWTPDDPDECPHAAKRIVHLHNPHNVPNQPDGVEVRLCVWHATRVCEEETTPHATG